jgi:hypothetical protein
MPIIYRNMPTTSGTELISLNCKHPVHMITPYVSGLQTHFVICSSVEVQLLSLFIPLLHVREKYVLIFTGTFLLHCGWVNVPVPVAVWSMA